MQKPSESHKLTSDNNIITFKKPVHDPIKKKKKTSYIFGKHLKALSHQKLRNKP